MKITCYGAVGEIGGNKVMLEDGGSAIMLDFGKSFSGESAYFDEFLQPRTHSCLRDLLKLGLLPPIPGIYRDDLLTHAGAWPVLSSMGLTTTAKKLYTVDLEGSQTFKIRFGPRLDGILLSHGHADHFQHLTFVDPSIPIYCSAETFAILRSVQEICKGSYESDICECPVRTVGVSGERSTFPGQLKIDRDDSNCARDIRVLEPDKSARVGAFEVTPVPVDHSVPGAYAYYIKGPSGKTAFYTGDLRFHGRYSAAPYEHTAKLREFTRNLQPDILITEGTRITSDARDSEQDVEERITEAVSGCCGLAIVDFGWKDIARFLTLVNVARRTGRKLAVNPKVAYLWEQLHIANPDTYPPFHETQDVTIFAYLKRMDSMTYALSDYATHKYYIGVCSDWGPRSADMKTAHAVHDLAYMRSRIWHHLTGVRAYQVASMPSKMILHAGYFDMNELFDVNPPAGSVFIRAATEPFSDDMAADERKLANWLTHFGINEGLDEKVVHHHVSGHASGPDLLDFISDMKPRCVIPIHTKNPEVFEQELGDKCEVIQPELGTPLQF